MKYPAWTTNPEMLDTGIRKASFITGIIPKVDGVAAEIVYSKVIRWAHRTYSWQTNGNGDHSELIRKETFPTVEAARAAWDSMSLPGTTLYKGNFYAFSVDNEAEAAYIERLNELGGDGAEIAAKLNACYGDADFIRSRCKCEQ